jgi:hypothetical protein
MAVWRLTDSRFIAAELAGLIERDKLRIQVLQNKEEDPVEDEFLEIKDRMGELEKRPIEYLKTVCLAQENLIRAMPELIAQNNKRILNLCLSAIGQSSPPPLP